MSDLSLIIPTYNECKNIPILLKRLQATLQNIDYEIIIVDDDSPDRSWEIAQNISITFPQLKVMRRTKNPGLSQSVVDGFKIAQGRFYFVMDSDLQHDEKILPKMYEEISKNDYDIIIASRVPQVRETKSLNFFRQLISGTATLLAYLVIPKNVTDPMSGYFALTAKAYQEVEDKINPRGFKILLEILGHIKNPKIHEINFVFQKRLHGKSKLSSKVIYEYLSAIYDLSVGKYFSRTFLKYCIVGVSGVISNQMSLMICKYAFHFSDEISLSIAIEMSILSNFILNNYWTFSEYRARNFRAFLKSLFFFHLVCSGGFIINQAITLQMTSYTGWNILITNLFGILFATIWNFVINSKINWK